MKILAIETSCDDTAVSILEVDRDSETPTFKVLSHLISSQVELHRAWGGVVPNIAKREHGKNIIPLIVEALKEANIEVNGDLEKINEEKLNQVEKILEKNPNLFDILKKYLPKEASEIDAIAVTEGPGLEPALWVGINTAKALSVIWDKPVIPVNHIEGHLVSPILESPKVNFPALGLIISGGHTELILVKKWGDYQKIGKTRDDAIGEAFDKVARLMNLPYPGGPEISRLAERARENNLSSAWDLPRPMINSDDFDFSFSGLKTAIRYKIEEKKELTDHDKETLALSFEEAVAEVLVKKITKALHQYGAQTLIIGGGVIANKYLRTEIKEAISREFDNVSILIPELKLTTDNATMIGLVAGLKNTRISPDDLDKIVAGGNLSI